ncbi:phage protein [Escherichia coli]|uniref:Phage protein n=3 Tax=Escherichia coli TaxID=562 RepID=A0A2X7FH63_ECOLX|nr:phage protein [Escherichia coli]
MSTITKERIELFIKSPLENGLTRGEQMELARIALASLEAEPVAWKATFTQIDHEYNTFTAMYSDKAEAERWVRLHKVGDFRADITPLYTAKPVPVVPGEIADDLMEKLPKSDAWANGFCGGWNSCRAVMLHGAEPVSQTHKSQHTQFEQVADLYEMQFDDGRTCAFHTDAQKAAQWLQACDGNRVQEYVKLERLRNALSGNYPVTPDAWISCSERMPEKNQNVLISVNFDSPLVEPLICSARYTGSTFRRGEATIKPGNGIEQATHWMPLPEPPQEVN